MLLLGIDLGTSSVKVSVFDPESGRSVASVSYPEREVDIMAPQPGWAEQSPDKWWDHVKQAILKAHATGNYDPQDIGAIGIAYQMHGLVCVNENYKSIRNAIIWCDSRAVETGEKAFRKIGESRCLSRLLNSPGNFTASKLAWVKKNEPEIFEKIHRIMLPGDFIAMKLTGNLTTTVPALSEGVFWDFEKNKLSKDIFKYFEFDKNLVPHIHPVFSPHGELKRNVAEALSLKTGIPVSYKAGDQPNNALSLNVLEPGEVAATAGTSGVIYAVSDKLTFDKQSRVNTFAHVNHKSVSLYDDEVDGENRLGVLLCINGAGIMNRWVRNMFAPDTSYAELDAAAKNIPAGSGGLMILPFCNGAERMLGNQLIGAQLRNFDLNIHTPAHYSRAVQEGIAFAFRYGLDILRENNIKPKVIRAGKANMFLSDVFTEAFVNATQVPVELYETDGSIGAAIGAGVGINYFSSTKEAFKKMKKIKTIEPDDGSEYEDLYRSWEKALLKQLK